MGSNVVLSSLKKIPKKELGLGFDNLVKPEYLNMRSVTNGSVTNGGFNANLSINIKNDGFFDPLSTIKNLRLSNINRVVIGNLNINSLPSKFNQLKKLVLNYADLLVLIETKLSKPFLNSQCLVDRFFEPLTEIDLEVG